MEVYNSISLRSMFSLGRFSAAGLGRMDWKQEGKTNFSEKLKLG